MAKIVIDLEGEREAYAVSQFEDLVHPKELNQLQKMLQYSVELAEDYSSKSKEPKSSKLMVVRRHDTIMLAGVRGCGKTTFMLSALNYIEQGSDGGQDFVGGVKILGIIDPTLIEEKVHIFVNIISMVKEIVSEKARKHNCFSEDNEFSRKYKTWQSSFRRLAEGLPSINGVGGDGFANEDWLDSEFVMEKGVQRAHAANSLEKNFHDYINKSLEFIDKRAFVLCFDDIDTHFEKGWPVLEVIHKYLTTPQFITILSGDPQLYSILIRQKQWEHFSDKLLKMEASSGDEKLSFKKTVAHLEEQYFLKILKPERRVFLSSLYQKAKDSKYPVYIKRKGAVDVPLRDYYFKLMKDIGIFSGSQQLSCFQFLASLPIRTQKQLLYAFNNSPEGIVDSISDIFWSDLSEKNVDVSSLRNAPQHIVTDILVYLVENNILNEGYTLTTAFSDQLVNGAQFALGAVIASRVSKEPALIFDYWIRIALSREVSALWEDRLDTTDQGPSIDNMILHCSIVQGRSARYVARLATAYIRASRGVISAGGLENKSWHGILPLSGLAGKSKKDTEKIRIDSVLKEISDESCLDGIMARLPLSGVTDHKGNTIPVYSFYNLLGVLGELIEVSQGIDEHSASQEVLRVIQKNTQFREHPVPNWASPMDIVTDKTESDVLADVAEEEWEEVDCEPLGDFAKQFTVWAKKGIGNLVSASILGKIFTRFFYTMNNMDKELSSEAQLGKWMHRMVVAFLNATLVVESLEKISSSDVLLSLKNPVTVDKIFVDNLNKLNKHNNEEELENLELSKWILSCPVWQFYLEKEIEELNQFLLLQSGHSKANSLSVEQVEGQDVWVGVIYYFLNRVRVRGHVAPKTVKKRFSVENPEDLLAIKEVFQDGQITPETVLEGTEGDLLVFMKESLDEQFVSQSITVTTVRSIKKRINEGSLQW